MVHVETVDLEPRGVRLPSERVGMVIAQPHLPIDSLTAAEPYHCTDEAKPQQLAVLTETLRVSRDLCHCVLKTHFTVFPEYSIPGLDGVALIDTTLQANDWPIGTIVIGGTDALTATQYVQLLQGHGTHVDTMRNGGCRVPRDRWVNCAITWVKAADGKLERWIQPKLHPAWEEMDVLHEHMFRGSSVYVFKGLLDNGVSFRFGTLVCFDWIATVDKRTPCQWILADLQKRANGDLLPLSWLFIIQRNKKPSHNTFLKEICSFFNQTEFPCAMRERACLVFANTAGKAVPGRIGEFGGCSVVLSPQSLFTQPSCAPTFSNGGEQFRDGSNLLSDYKDVYFRERGACIHSFMQVNPGSLSTGPASRTIAVEEARVYPISGAQTPRAPGAAVPSAVKWLNDELDDLPSLSANYQTVPLVSQVDTAHKRNIDAFRMISSQSTTRAIKLAAEESKAEHEDKWDTTESEALRHLVHTLDIMDVGFPPLTVVDTQNAHAVVRISGQPVDLLAIRGASHNDCIKHSEKYLPNPHRQVFLISRDLDNTAWPQRFGRFLQPTARQLGEERNITDPSSSFLHLGYQDLLEIFQGAATSAAVSDGIKAKLAA